MKQNLPTGSLVATVVSSRSGFHFDILALCACAAGLGFAVRCFLPLCTAGPVRLFCLYQIHFSLGSINIFWFLLRFLGLLLPKNVTFSPSETRFNTPNYGNGHTGHHFRREKHSRVQPEKRDQSKIGNKIFTTAKNDGHFTFELRRRRRRSSQWVPKSVCV